MPALELEDICASLSRPATGRRDVTRRRFLQATLAAAAGAAVVPSWLADAVDAAPLGARDRVLIVVLLGGGNDGLNTVVRPDHGRYRDLRKALAIPADKVLPLGGGVGLHPSLGYLKQRWDQGQLAVVESVGRPGADLSHFTSMASWMAGTAGDAAPTSGWIGRYLDTLPQDQLAGVVIGSSVPLHFQGMTTRGAALPPSMSNAFGVKADNPSTARMHEAARAFAAGPSGKGPIADLMATSLRGAVDSARRVAPLYGTDLPKSGLARSLAVCAQVVNADLGARVLGVSLGSFDHHQSQLDRQAGLLRQLDEGIAAFFARLSPRFADRVSLMTFSEFGRRAQANGSSGTDHGTAGPMFVVGNKVRGGLHGQPPNLDDLDRAGNLKHAVDFRSVYSTVTGSWLRGDAERVLGRTFEPLPLFR